LSLNAARLRGCGLGCDVLPNGEEFGERTVSPPQNFFIIFQLKMVRFGAFLGAVFYSSAACFTCKIT